MKRSNCRPQRRLKQLGMPGKKTIMSLKYRFNEIDPLERADFTREQNNMFHPQSKHKPLERADFTREQNYSLLVAYLINL